MYRGCARRRRAARDRLPPRLAHPLASPTPCRCPPRQVHALVEHCLQHRMTVQQTCNALELLGVAPKFTALGAALPPPAHAPADAPGLPASPPRPPAPLSAVWQRLELENPEFFEAYRAQLLEVPPRPYPEAAPPRPRACPPAPRLPCLSPCGPASPPSLPARRPPSASSRSLAARPRAPARPPQLVRCAARHATPIPLAVFVPESRAATPMPVRISDPSVSRVFLRRPPARAKPPARVCRAAPASPFSIAPLPFFVPRPLWVCFFLVDTSYALPFFHVGRGL
jgi:hypothetical protein